MTDLDQAGRALLRMLVDLFPKVGPNDPETFISYSEAHRRLRLKVLFGHAGRSLQAQGLDSLATWAHDNGFPAVTGLIVRDEARDPGSGYFKLYGKQDPEDIQWWIGEVNKAVAFDWSPYLNGTSSGSKQVPQTRNSDRNSDAVFIPLRSIARPDSRFFLKSEYGPFSDWWPVVSFSLPALKVKLQREYRTGRDFIVYTGTSSDDTTNPQHRGRLLSLVQIDKTKTYLTKNRIPPDSWKWAEAHYPGQWSYCFQPLGGWSIAGLPRSTEIVPEAYSSMGLYPYRGMVREITGSERDSLLDVGLVPIKITFRPGMDESLTIAAILNDKTLNEVATRLADLVENRVNASGTTVQKTAPMRSAPVGLKLIIAELLRATPLTCALCGGLMELKPANRLLQPSPDRVDSTLGDYGPKNFQIAHLACNLGKNAATVAEFEEWLDIVRDGMSPHKPRTVLSSLNRGAGRAADSSANGL